MNRVSKILLPGLYIGLVVTMCLSAMLVISGIRNYVSENKQYKYAVETSLDGDIEPVISIIDDTIIKPYIDENISIKRKFYDQNSSKEDQEKSLINYENTYIKNNGVDYSSKESFDVVSIIDSEVINIEKSEIYGTIITTKNDNVTCIYSNIENTTINKGYKLSKGEIIGATRKSSLDNDDTYMLHFEILKNNKHINPETIYNKNVSILD